MIYKLEIKLYNNDEFDSDREILKPIFSKDFARLESIKKQLEEDFNKKNNPKSQNVLKINISELVVSNEIKREKIDQLKKDIKSFFNF